MDETPLPQQPSPASPQPAAEPEPKKKRPLTPAVLSKRYLQEGAIVFLVFLWFAYDGWLSTEISEHGRSFSRGGALLLGYWVLHCAYFTIKYRRLAREQPQPPTESPPSGAP